MHAPQFAPAAPPHITVSPSFSQDSPAHLPAPAVTVGAHTFEPGRRLTLREWCALVGTLNVGKVATRADVSMVYMKQLACRYKLPSYKLAKNLVQLSRELTPGFSPDLELMLEPLPPRSELSRWWQPEPSAIYEAHQRYLLMLNEAKSAQEVVAADPAEMHKAPEVPDVFEVPAVPEVQGARP